MEGESQEKSKKRQPKTIIIGGGIAGLASGKYLELEGLGDYIILEATDRIGGRIWSVPVGRYTTLTTSVMLLMWTIIIPNKHILLKKKK